MFWIGKYVGTHQARHFFTEIMKQRFDIHVVLRKKRVKQGFRGTQLETMKSLDFLFLALLESWLYYDNLLACLNQWWNVVLRAFVILSWILIPENVTLSHSVLACLSNVTQTLIKKIVTASEYVVQFLFCMDFNCLYVWTATMIENRPF